MTIPGAIREDGIVIGGCVETDMNIKSSDGIYDAVLCSYECEFALETRHLSFGQEELPRPTIRERSKKVCGARDLSWDFELCLRR